MEAGLLLTSDFLFVFHHVHVQVVPKLSNAICKEIDTILGNKPEPQRRVSTLVRPR